MGWSMWHVYGTGFNAARVEPEAYRDFICKHAQALRDAGWKNRLYFGANAAQVKGVDEFVAFLTEDECFPPKIGDLWIYLDTHRAADPVSVIMTQETGVKFDAPGATDEGDDFVLFIAREPWNYNETERNLTQEALFGIMRKYADELGVSFEEDVDLTYAG